MPKIVEPLREVRIVAAKAREKDYTLSDGGGLELLVKNTGRKIWRWRYARPDGRRNMISLGHYPDVSLSDARALRAEHLATLKRGDDPKPDKAATLSSGRAPFEHFARAWLTRQLDWSSDHLRRITARFERHLFPKLGQRPLCEITARELRDVLAVVEAGGYLDIAARMRQQLVLIFRAAVLDELINYNPAQDLLGNFRNPVPAHRPALALTELPELLARIERFNGRPVTRYALLLNLHLFLRSSELRFGRWPEIDFDARIWTIPPEREPVAGVKFSDRGAKMRTPHLVPLSSPVLVLLDEIKKNCGEKAFVLPGDFVGDSPISENTINGALRQIGYDTKTELCGHGFRTMACGALNESGLFSRDAIERQMSHQERDGVRAAYIHKAEFLNERRKMMDWWSAYIEKNRGGYVPPWEFVV